MEPVRVPAALTLWAVNGAACIEVIANGSRHMIDLERTHTTKVPARTGTAYRFYNDYRIPDLPIVPPPLRGAQLRLLRINTTREDKHRGFSRSDALRAIAPSDQYWPEINKLRPVAESINRMIKRRHPNGRAPATGISRQHFHLICAALFHNLEAVLAHEQRTETELAPTGTTDGLEVSSRCSAVAGGPSPPTRTLRTLP